ncbi:MAG TPA: hypothetical protein VM240_11055 [Verrucomicrobiae bacterium]|nr:hypothetical protein [Verrucomicrobiae bacterium]
MKNILLLALAPVFLAGCAASSYCEGEQDYAVAGTMPPLQSPPGVTLPESASALKIPPQPATAVPYGETYKDEDGDDAVRCLDRPPSMPPPAVVPEAAPAPAPVPGPAEQPSTPPVAPAPG